MQFNNEHNEVSRRSFLQTAISVVGASSVITPISACRQLEPRGKKKIRMGMLPGGGCYKGQGFTETVKSIAKAGFDGVMLYLDQNFTRNNLPEINRVLKGEGLTVFQVHPPWPNIGSVDAKTRNSALDTYKCWIDYSHKIDAQMVIVHPSGAEPSPDRNHVLDLTVQSVKILTKEASPMIIAVENVCPSEKVAQPIGSTPEELIWLVNAANSSNIGICLDTSHCLASRVDLQTFITKAGIRIVTTHLHDMTLSYDPQRGVIKDEHLMFGMGKINWKTLLGLLKTNCPCAPWIAEIDVKGSQQEQERSFTEISNFFKKYA